MSWRRIILVFFAVFPIVGRTTSAMDFTEHSGTISSNLTAVFASGEIFPGDTEKLTRFLTHLPVRKNTAIYFASPGGNLYEGLKLGLYFRKNDIKTVVEGASDCASACAIAFLGGTDRNGKPWRSSSSNSRLGFHAFSNPGDANPNSDQLQSVVSDLLSYGKAVDAPIELLISGFATPSSDIYWVPQNDVCKLGIKLWSVDTNAFLCN